jgi:hypothetical protein
MAWRLGSLEASQEFTAEVGVWQMELSQTWELAAEGSTGWSQQSEHKVGMRWSSHSKDMSPEAEEHLPLEAITTQRDWELCLL